MERPERGLPLLRAVLKQIDDHPETWGQYDLARKTACGTTHCVAGHAVVLRGHSLAFNKYNDVAYDTTEGACIWDLAELELGLEYDEAGDLFHENNSREDIQRIAEQIALRLGETL